MRPAVAELLLGSRPCYTTLPDATDPRSSVIYGEDLGMKHA
jgi:hypothetical protein